MTVSVEAVVLRTLRYGEADVIANIFTQHEGRRGVIAKGARKPRNRVGVRIEPFLVLNIQIIDGRGDLGIVRSVDVINAHDSLRMSWHAQQQAAAALDLVSKVTVEHQPIEPLFRLLCSFLKQLDVTTKTLLSNNNSPDELRSGHCGSLLTAFELKLLHVIGISPRFSMCVRCNQQSSGISSFSAVDGGVICSNCQSAADQELDLDTWNTAVHLLHTSLAEITSCAQTDLPSQHVLRTIKERITHATCREHAGTN